MTFHFTATLSSFDSTVSTLFTVLRAPLARATT